MEILEFGNKSEDIIVLIHGFESPYQIWYDYIEHYQNDYHIIVPILPGHNPNKKEEFVSFDLCARELEDFIIDKYGNHVYAIYGMSMGGVLAANIWQNGRLHIDKIIMESSPLLTLPRPMISIMTKQYLSLTHKVQEEDSDVLKKAVGTMVKKDELKDFIQLLDNISDKTIINYLKQTGEFSIPENMENDKTEIYYYYGGRAAEMPFKKVAKFIQKNYKNAQVFCNEGKAHCEDSLIHPQKWIKVIDKVLIK